KKPKNEKSSSGLLPKFSNDIHSNENSFLRDEKVVKVKPAEVFSEKVITKPIIEKIRDLKNDNNVDDVNKTDNVDDHKNDKNNTNDSKNNNKNVKDSSPLSSFKSINNNNKSDNDGNQKNET